MPAIPDPSRDRSLQDWARARARTFGFAPESLAAASSDASFRRYFRVQAASTHSSGNASFIVMDAPPALNDLAPFVHAREVFARSDVRVPAILEVDAELGFMLLEDFGDQQFLKSLNAHTASALYGAALDALVALQAGSGDTGFAPYDAALLRTELELFRDWYCVRHLGVELSKEQNAVLDAAFELLVSNALAQPQVPVHRDYHSRNLMVLPDMSRGPGILDFQDAVTGPITYDLVSLLRDAYIEWDEEQVLDWAVRYWERARKAGLPVNAQFGEFYRDFEWMGLQRHLKVLGIFARLKHRDGKDGYLKDMPLVSAYVRKCAARYNGFGALLRLLDVVEGQQSRVGYTF
jgi:aminoglycoside/choline kinase family phosphotransferase